MVARAIHRLSRRKDRPFLACDCSALAPGLLESELFGHVKGSFSGAIATKLDPLPDPRTPMRKLCLLITRPSYRQARAFNKNKGRREAAHAGEAGRGFAVVADEIRKLAESASLQSGEIDRDISTILNEIATVAASANDSDRAFARILEEIALVNQFEQDIKRSMLDQSTGSRQIVESIGRINETTAHVRDSSIEITEGSRAIRTEMQHLAALSEDLNSTMHHIEAGADRIRAASGSLDQVGGSNAEQITALAKVVGKFSS